MENAEDIFTEETLAELFPPTISDAFFEALFGDAEEGAYDIRLSFRGQTQDTLAFALELHQRPGKCLACNLTYGLPEVFSRHPLINLQGLAEKISARFGRKSTQWRLGATQNISKEMYAIPLVISLK